MNREKRTNRIGRIRRNPGLHGSSIPAAKTLENSLAGVPASAGSHKGASAPVPGAFSSSSGPEGPPRLPAEAGTPAHRSLITAHRSPITEQGGARRPRRAAPFSRLLGETACDRRQSYRQSSRQSRSKIHPRLGGDASPHLFVPYPFLCFMCLVWPCMPGMRSHRRHRKHITPACTGLPYLPPKRWESP